MSVSVDQMKLGNFMDMVRMSAEGNLKTSAEKTSGYIYADTKGFVHNVRHQSFSKGLAAQNLRLRQALVDAFSQANASTAFLQKVREQLGLQNDNTRATAVADKPLSRREVKVLLQSFNEGTFTTDDKTTKRSHGFSSFKLDDVGMEGWTSIDTLAGLKEQAIKAMVHCPNTIPRAHQNELMRVIGSANSLEFLQEMILELNKGNVDPCPFGGGMRSIDLPDVVAENFKEELLNDFDPKVPAPSDDKIIADMEADVNRQWVITIGGQKLPKSSETADQDKAILDIINNFFTPDESKTVRNRMLRLVNQRIETPLSVLSMMNGSLPGGCILDQLQKPDTSERHIDVSRLENGHVCVTFKAMDKGMSTLADIEVMSGKKGPVVIDGHDENFRETTVSYEFFKKEDGTWDVSFVQNPHLNYQYGRRLSAEEVKGQVKERTMAILSDPKALFDEMSDIYETKRADLLKRIDRNQEHLEYILSSEDPSQQAIEAKKVQIEADRKAIQAMKPIDQKTIEDFCSRKGTLDMLLEKFKQTDLPLHAKNLGRWNDNFVKVCIYDLLKQQVANK